MTNRYFSWLYIFAIVAMATLVPGSAAIAQSFSTSGGNDRAGRWEAFAGARLVLSGSADFPGGSNIKTEDDLGFDFGFGYNFNDHLLLSGEMNFSTIDYGGSLASADNPPALSVPISGTLDVGTIGASLTWNLLARPLTPYASAALGWTWIDTNIAQGPPEIGCWWDPWFGQVCTAFVETRSEDMASYGLGVGVRWDFGPGAFARFGYDERWLDIKNANGTPDFGVFRLEVGSKF